MPVYRQDDVYEEEEVKPQARSKGATEEEVEETTQPQKRSFSFNPKLIAIIACGVVLVIIIVLLLGFVTSKRDAKAQQEMNDKIYQDILAQEELKANMPSEPVVAETTPVVQQSSVSYSQKEISALRLWGYTADEIELASRDGIAAKTLVAQAKHDRELAQKEALDAVSDTASPEYQAILNKTWLGGTPLDMSTVEPGRIYNRETATVNVDYEKCGAQGNQLFLKLILDDGSSAFMYITPSRWVELPESGNIVVTIARMEAGGLSIITDIQEVRVDN